MFGLFGFCFGQTREVKSKKFRTGSLCSVPSVSGL